MSMDYMVELIDQGISAMSEMFRIELDAQPFDIKEFRHCIVMELIKDAYFESEPKSSLRSYVEDGAKDSDDIRMRNQRMLKYAQHYRTIQNNHMVETLGYGHPGLLPDDMGDIEKKLSGHKLTRMQFFELSTMADHPVLKAIISKRICSTKKISNAEFIEMMDDYDRLTQSLVDKLDEDPLFSTIALFTLEWKYNIDLFYSCAVEAEKHKCKEIPLENLSMLCAVCSLPLATDMSRTLHTESRFIRKRTDFVPRLYDGSDWMDIALRLMVYHNMRYEMKYTMTVNDVPLVFLFQKLTTAPEWAAYLQENYNLRGVFKKKEWTPARIRYMRKLFETMYRDVETPKL